MCLSWNENCCVAKDNLELLILLLLSTMFEITGMPGSCGAKDGSQGFALVGQYKVRELASPSVPVATPVVIPATARRFRI